jgi:hypothetical protein
MDTVDHRVHRYDAQRTRAHDGGVVADPAQDSRSATSERDRQLGRDGFDQRALGDG